MNTNDSTGDGNNGHCTYESAVKDLLSPGIHQATTKEEIARSARRRTRTVSDMRFYWKKILRKSNHPVSQKSQDRQRPLLIHVTGTKGKGSTACMCEVILREHGYKTGLFTSPHLIDIRERIRWNGNPIHERIFADVYWKIRRALEKDDDDDNEADPPPKLPGYFRMLTLMGLYAFLHELSGKVDVIILEVGMGGRYDATNFLDASTQNFSRVANGVTLLDLDHTRILGDTLGKIAWEKGGIFSVDKLNPNGTSERPSDSTITITSTKTGTEEKGAVLEDAEAFKDRETLMLPSKNIILDSNTQGVLAAMKSCARVEGKGGELCLVDATGSKLREALKNEGLSLGLAGMHQYGNAALALALCQSVAASAKNENESEGVQTGSHGSNTIGIDSPTTLAALAAAKWPGRCQTLEWSDTSSSGSSRNKRKTVLFYLDGAHTPQSLEATVDWLRTKNSTTATISKKTLPILVFNCSHERNPVELLELFLRYEVAPPPTNRRFSKVYFAKSDSSRPSPVEKASAESLLEERGILVRSELLLGKKTERTWQETLAIVWRHLTTEATAMPENTVLQDDSIRCNMTASQVFKEIREELHGRDGSHTTQVFVTGSLYLVGSFLTALEWNEESSPPL